MGYTTYFEGSFSIDRPVEKELADYINRFSKVRHMIRDNKLIKENYPNWKEFSYKGNLGMNGEYFVTVSDCFGQDFTSDIIDYNRPPETQPGLWCQWVIPSETRNTIVWDEGEKFYEYEKWLVYIIDRFLKPNGYIVNGQMMFQGEDEYDSGYILVDDNKVSLHFY